MIIDIRGLGFSYKNKIVLDDISLGIREGEIIGILGPNGCGKTTLLRHLNRNLSPDKGCILLTGDDLADIRKKEIAQSVAVVPQGNEIRFAFTVRDIVSMGRMPFQGVFDAESRKDTEIIDAAMRSTGVYDMADREINTMSGGERQRVIIARALAQTPRILLMDEPTLHLDISMQFEVLDLMENLSRNQGITVAIVSHDLPMVARYCDRIVLIHDHTVFAVGKTQEVLTAENMKIVFNVDAALEKDPVTGRNTVHLFGSCKHGEPDCSR